MLHGVDAAHEVEPGRLGLFAHAVRHLHPEPLGLEHLGRQVKGNPGEHAQAAGRHPLVAGDPLRDPQGAEPHPGRAIVGVGFFPQNFRCFLAQRAGEVGRLHRADKDFPGLEIQAVHMKSPRHVQIDGARVAVAQHPATVHGAEQNPFRQFENGKGRPAAAQIDVPLRQKLRRKPGGAVGRLQQLQLFGQVTQSRLCLGGLQQRLACGQRQFRCGADQLGTGDVRVVRVHGHRLHRPAEEVLRVAHEVLVQGVLVADEHHQRFPLLSAHPAGPLPGGHHRARVADEQTDVQVADVDAQFQGRGGDNAQQAALGQARLDLPPLLGQETGTVRGDQVLPLLEPLPGPDGDQLGHLARLAVDDGPQTATDRRFEHQGGGGGGRVERVEEQHVARRPPGPGTGDLAGGRVDEQSGVFARIADGGRGEDKGRIGAVEGADALEPPQHPGHVAAEHAAVGVHLVDDHMAKAREKMTPFGMVGEQAEVEHIRVGDEHRRRQLADLPAPVIGGVAVVDGRRSGMTPYRLRQQAPQLLHGLQLVLGERLEREQAQGAAVRVAQVGLQDRQGVDEALARGRGRGHHRVSPGEDGLDGRMLVTVQVPDAQVLEQLLQFRGEQVDCCRLRGRGREHPVGDHLRSEPARSLECGNVFRHRTPGVGSVVRAVH